MAGGKGGKKKGARPPVPSLCAGYYLKKKEGKRKLGGPLLGVPKKRREHGGGVRNIPFGRPCRGKKEGRWDWNAGCGGVVLLPAIFPKKEEERTGKRISARAQPNLAGKKKREVPLAFAAELLERKKKGAQYIYEWRNWEKEGKGLMPLLTFSQRGREGKERKSATGLGEPGRREDTPFKRYPLSLFWGRKKKRIGFAENPWSRHGKKASLNCKNSPRL